MDTTQTSPEVYQALLDQAQVEISTKSLLKFGDRVYRKFQAPKHIQYLAKKLEAVERGDIRRLAISLAPGHGKSTLLTVFLAWFLGRDATRRMLALSASESLAFRNSRYVREMVRSEKWPWPDVKLKGESLEEWYTNAGGGIRAIGKDGTVTGFRAEGILCDDIQKDAGTEASRQKDEEWFREVLTTRLEPGGFAVIIQTRWHDDDIIGRLAKGESADQWEFINIPVIADEDDPLGRAEGDVLWPERFSLEAIEFLKQECGPVAFAAQYMGDPIPRGGATYKEEWFKQRYTTLPPLPIKALVIDSAWKDGPRNDWSVLATWGSDKKNFYLLDVVRRKWEFPELQRQIIETYIRNECNILIVEDKQSGTAVIQQIKANTRFPVVSVTPTKDKESRAESSTFAFEGGRVYLPESAPWLATWLNEHLRFPAGKDDQVDTTSMAILFLNTKTQLEQKKDYSKMRNFMAR
ncbi:MAG: phage terminase large subunit [Patescibacteria group bacterium]|nr:phage terminase large subunit [Patescibacteria group bacterium]